MKLEKRSTDTPQTEPSAVHHHHHKGRSHILIYILILFIAAFLLMTLSFLSHQRTNEQVLGQLSSNVSNLSKLQSALEENLRLQEKINDQTFQMESLEDELDAAQDAQTKLSEKISALEQSSAQQQKELDALRQTASAVDALTQLQIQLMAGDMTACRQIIADMESSGLDKLLPASSAYPGGISPQQMFQQAKLLAADSEEPDVSRETPP